MNDEEKWDLYKERITVGAILLIVIPLQTVLFPIWLLGLLVEKCWGRVLKK